MKKYNDAFYNDVDAVEIMDDFNSGFLSISDESRVGKRLERAIAAFGKAEKAFAKEMKSITRAIA